VVIENPELSVTHGAKIRFLVIVCKFFVKAWLAKQTPLLHLPLPLWLLAVPYDLFATYRANIWRFRLLKHKLPRLLYVAVAAEQAFNPPVFASLVPMAPKLPSTYRAIYDLLFTENMQAKLLARTATKTYICVILVATVLVYYY
jgi:hypothetical protein